MIGRAELGLLAIVTLFCGGGLTITAIVAIAYFIRRDRER